MIDTNVVLDFLCKREPFFKNAFEIISRTAENQFKTYITANSITDIIYILRKQFSVEEVKNDLLDLLEILDIVDLIKKDIENTLLSDNTADLEDELIYQCAKRIECNCIVTRDKKGFKNVQEIDILTPVEFIENLSNNSNKY
jgi:predicted nucleic acid-binding protein